MIDLQKNNLLKEATNSMSLGIRNQENSNFKNAKLNMQDGIEKIKKILVSDNTINKEMIIEYYSLFEKFLQNVNYDEE